MPFKEVNGEERPRSQVGFANVQRISSKGCVNRKPEACSRIRKLGSYSKEENGCVVFGEGDSKLVTDI